MQNSLETQFYFGQRKLEEKVELLIRNKNIDAIKPEYFDPYLYTFLIGFNNFLTLDQILFSETIIQSNRGKCKVWVNRHGVIEFPRLGYVMMKGIKGEHADINYENSDKGLKVKSENGDFLKLIKRIVLCKEDIEILKFGNPLIDIFFQNTPIERYKELPNNSLKNCYTTIQEAFSLIKECLPKYYEILKRAVKRIVLFSEKQPHSFASIRSHGTIFINIKNGNTALFFAEDIIHQGGHIVFNAICENKDLLQIDKGTSIATISGRNDDRTVFESLHGLYTESMMNLFWIELSNNLLFHKYDHMEINGRFAYILTKFGIDIQNLADKNIFSEDGWEFYSWLYLTYAKIAQQKGSFLSKLDLSEQPYCFDLDKFKERNTRHFVEVLS